MAGSGGSGGGSVGGGGGGFSGGGSFGHSSGGFGHSSGGFRHGSFINSTFHTQRFGGSGDSNGSGGSNGSGTPGPKSFIGIVLFVIIFVVFSIIETGVFDSDYDYEINFDEVYTDVYSYQDYEFYEDSEEYEAYNKEVLSSELCTPIDKYVTDGTYYSEFKGIKSDLKESLKNFYSATGIQPHLYLVDYGAFDDFYTEALNMYYTLFEDEGHFLLAVATDSYDYEYEIVIGDDTWEILNEQALSFIYTNIEDAMFSAEAGDYESVAKYLAEAIDKSAKQVMTGFTYIEDTEDIYNDWYEGEDESETPTINTDNDEGHDDEPQTTIIDDDSDSFFEDEFVTDEDDFLSTVFEEIEAYMENVNVYAIIIIAGFIVAAIVIIIASRKRNNYKVDSYSKSTFDNYDEQFLKKDDKYDKFLK